jgi:hypothetical protein
MAVELDQYIMVTNMCVKFDDNWTNTFQELDHTNFSDVRIYVRTDKGNSICLHFVGGIKTTNWC